MRSKARTVAFGGMMTAVAIVIMNLGSLIPLNTYVCPVLCMLITPVVVKNCGRKISWCYYAAVSLLALLLAPDREAALVYVLLGYYPLIKPWLDKRPFPVLWKLLLFTAAGWAVYALTVFVLGISPEEGGILAALTLVLWDLLFLMVDLLLGRKFVRR